MYFEEIEIPELLESDPFRFRAGSAEWNSCIGIQGDEHSYVFGFLKASVTLINDVIKNKKYGDRDTVVWPALYSVRHGIELGLKQLHDDFAKAGILKEIFVKNHRLDEYINSLTENRIGDKEIDYLFSKLKVFVDSISNLDADGQELRYFRNINGDRNLPRESIINLHIILICAESILEIFDRLYYRVGNFLQERQIGTFTNYLSRRDLDRIASILPNRQSWSTDEFIEAKTSVTAEFNLGSRQFSLALTKIEENRYLAQNIGIYSKLKSLDDAKVEWIVRSVIKRNNKYFAERNDSMGNGSISIGSALNFNLGITENDILKEMSVEELADLKTVFYIGRDNSFPEYYESEYESYLSILKLKNTHHEGLWGEIGFLSKMNLADDFVKGLRLVGRKDLAEKMEVVMSEIREY